MAKYYLTFAKLDDMKYISHLDLLRLFKRGFKSAEIRLSHSEGFNPHPKMSFGQPLSLGYEGLEEWLEFETKEAHDPNDLKNRLGEKLPKGIIIGEVTPAQINQKPLAASCYGADYQITIPLKGHELDPASLEKSFLEESEILVEKATKKSKELRTINIRPMINSLSLNLVDDNIIMTTNLAAGSSSNLSPELLLQGFLNFSHLNVPRHEIDVMRTGLSFQNN